MDIYGFFPTEKGGVSCMSQDVGISPDGSSSSHGGLCQNREDISVSAGLLMFTKAMFKALDSGPNIGGGGAIWKLDGYAVHSGLEGWWWRWWFVGSHLLK